MERGTGATGVALAGKDEGETLKKSSTSKKLKRSPQASTLVSAAGEPLEHPGQGKRESWPAKVKWDYGELLQF